VKKTVCYENSGPNLLASHYVGLIHLKYWVCLLYVSYLCVKIKLQSQMHCAAIVFYGYLEAFWCVCIIFANCICCIPLNTFVEKQKCSLRCHQFESHFCENTLAEAGNHLQIIGDGDTENFVETNRWSVCLSDRMSVCLSVCVCLSDSAIKHEGLNRSCRNFVYMFSSKRNHNLFHGQNLNGHLLAGRSKKSKFSS